MEDVALLEQVFSTDRRPLRSAKSRSWLPGLCTVGMVKLASDPAVAAGLNDR